LFDFPLELYEAIESIAQVEEEDDDVGTNASATIGPKKGTFFCDPEEEDVLAARSSSDMTDHEDQAQFVDILTVSGTATLLLRRRRLWPFFLFLG
jgi:hypothetical protein